jgi:F0F1-type ATP synthase membrane subunit b/b'
MQVVLQILSQLGANYTAFIQFVIFIVSISFLAVVVYGPYFKAYDERLKLTKGSDQIAEETENEARKMEVIFQSRAREINQKIQNVFETSKSQAAETATTILNQSKASVADQTDRARADIGLQKASAQKQISSISQEVAAEISRKITGAI